MLTIVPLFPGRPLLSRVLAQICMPALLILSSTFAFAESATGNVMVTILDQIDLTETKSVDYGSLTNETGDCTINATAQKIGTDGSSCSGDAQLGEFSIAGTEDQMVSISVSPSTASNGVTFSPTLHTPSTAVLSGGQATVTIGGTLSMENASSGMHNLSYTISVNYN